MVTNFAGSPTLVDGLKVTERPLLRLQRGFSRCILIYMSFMREIVRDKPKAAYAMDDTSPFQDYSGYNRSGTATGGTPPTHASLIAGTTFSQVFSSSITATLAAPVFYQGIETAPFSLEGWFRVVTSDTPEQQLLGNSGQMDGLTILGNKVNFVIKFTSAPEARISYDIQQGRRIHAVGVKTETKIALFVNGVLVQELSLTEAQQASTYVTSNGNLYCGATSGTQKIAVAGLAAYASALDQTAIARHYAMGTKVPDGEDVASSFKGDRIPLSVSNSNLFLDQWWTTDSDWKAAQLFNVAVIDGQLRPQFDQSNVSVAGKWYDSFSLDIANTTSIHGVVFDWDGQGMTVEASLDSTTWVAITRGVNVSLITPGFNPTGKELQLRVTFAGGIQDDDAFLDNLNAVGIKTAASNVIDGRTITFNSAYPQREYTPLEFHDNWGAEIASGGSLVISADTTDAAVGNRVIELWIKRTSSGTNPTISDTGTYYQNGVAATATLVTGQWTLLHIVKASTTNNAITINGPAQVGQVVLYENTMTAAQIAENYAQYTLSSPIVADDTSVITVAESDIPVSIYAYDWSIQGAG